MGRREKCGKEHHIELANLVVSFFIIWVEGEEEEGGKEIRRKTVFNFVHKRV